jgi:hypothetical protein
LISSDAMRMPGLGAGRFSSGFIAAPRLAGIRGCTHN